MSLRSDARDCLIQAIHDRKNLDVTPEQLNVFSPSDSDIGVQDGYAWLKILESAAACLRSKHHVVDRPEYVRATALHGELLIASQLYLEELASSGGTTNQRQWKSLLLAGSALAVIGTTALALRQLGKGRSR